MKKRPLIVGITLGDVNGIGPEISLRAAYANAWRGMRIVLIGAEHVVAREAKRQKHPLPPAWSPDSGADPAHRVVVWDPTPDRDVPLQPGSCTAGAARAAYQWIAEATRAACSGALSALVTAPINKEGFMKAGIDVPGHTELLARLTGTTRFEMMLMTEQLRVVLATRHLPLRDVAAALTRRGVRETIEMTADALTWLGVRNPRIAVCGLNPHAGDGGALGDEERRIIAPAMRAVRRKGLRLEGPVPADTVFHDALKGRYAAIVAMYHDQGLAPFKMIGFDQGINVTLGLPIVRTSPDHGTAYAIAGKGCARAASMVEAIRWAGRLAARPHPWRAP